MNDSAPTQRALTPFTLLSPEDREWWIEQCYVLPDANSALYDPERSLLLIGERGSGLSTLFEVFQHVYPLVDDHPMPLTTPQPFCFAYPIYCWPGQPQALFSHDDTSHFKQWMALIAHHLIHVFKRDPALLQRPSVASFEFLVWLMRHYLGSRRADGWCQFVEQQHPAAEIKTIVAEARRGKYDNVYTDDHANDTAGQIEECVELLAQLGWNGVYAVAELSFEQWSAFSADHQATLQASIERLLSHLTPIQHQRFGFKIGVVADVMISETIKKLPRGRASVMQHTWTADALSDMSTRLLSALADKPLRIEELIAPALWHDLHNDMLHIWGKPSPLALVAIIHSCYEHAPTFTPLQPDQISAIRTKLYQQYAPLRYDPASNAALVWRGATKITLDEAQFHVFQALWRHGRTKTHAQKPELQNLAGSSANLDKIISRIREKIEPFPNARIYLQRNQSQGIWLECCQF